MKRFTLFASALALVMGSVVGIGSAAHAAGGFRIVRPHESIQAAIGAVGEGGTVLVHPGVYAQHIVITHGVTLLAYGVTLLPPPPPIKTGPSPCSQPGDPNEDGVCIAGSFTAGPNGIVVKKYVEGVTIIGLTVGTFPGTGILQIGGKGSTFVANTALHNGEYGIAAFDSTGTTEVLNTARNSGEAGLYIGDSPRANATLIANNVSKNGFGIFVRDAEHGTLIGNESSGNCIGVLFLADAPGPDGSFSVSGNSVHDNTKACPASEDGPALSGIGIAIAGAHDVSVNRNNIHGNKPGGATEASGGVVVFRGDVTAPANNHVQGNLIVNNQPDILWDGSGAGNVLKPNNCHTSTPAGLCS